jgi:hypothetical protein
LLGTDFVGGGVYDLLSNPQVGSHSREGHTTLRKIQEAFRGRERTIESARSSDESGAALSSGFGHDKEYEFDSGMNLRRPPGSSHPAHDSPRSYSETGLIGVAFACFDWHILRSSILRKL